ncbi:ABC transporter substrate-binding protein [Microvirga lotononidis]|uniref:ABC transporter, substrate-binding protein, aliphatic sulfonates family n=1 Tax=Microvirga lotononidis TaxID=864069 RepID=I4YV69_9HYPH|nr:ABC transporter substrate-binding protein [Microvirga lotononidis]EIM27861.1 ABC transporter, substrate-binding protein, aliphatic sulfonates family [Microvirga lotononidis]WQO28010.1 ABC transporter substrate-binding protein [Microvirga lotononidis]
MRHGWRILLLSALSLVAAHAPTWAQQATTVRVGHFPNITHVQALVARAFERQGRNWFAERLGPGVKVEWYVYNAGPSAMEAIFAKSLDLTYVGPNPALNAYARSRGAEVRVIAGAVNGGSALVVQGDSTLTKPADFKGKRIATPQFGNTQDVAARAWLVAGGLRITQTGGDAQVVPTSNPDQLSLFQGRQLDAVWTVEPWVSRLESEAGGKILVEEKDAITTILVSSVDFLAKNRDLAKRFVVAHRELTDWIQKNPDEAQRMARDELKASFRLDMPPELVAKAWSRMVITPDTSREAFQSFVTSAQQVGFLRDTPDLSRLIEAP